METKIRYRYVFNRKKRLNAMGEALVQIEARQKDRKTYFATGIYVKPSEWTGSEVAGRVDATMLNGMLQEVLLRLQMIEMGAWRQGVWPQLEHLRRGMARVDAGVDGQTRGLDGQTDGRGLDGQTDGRGLDGQTDGRGLDGQTVGRGLDGQTVGRGLDGQTDGRGLDGQTVGRGLDGQTDGRGLDGQTVGRGLDEQTDGRTGEESEGVLAFARRVVEPSGRRESTKSCLMGTARLMERWRQGVTLRQLDYDLLCGFEQHLRGLGDCKNTIAKHLHNLRTLVGEARRRGLATGWPARGYRIRTERHERTTLSDDELRRVAQTKVCPTVRDAFLFCCKTGLRYSDYVRVAEEHFVVRDGEQWLQLRMHKTGRMVALPLQLLAGVLGPLGPRPAIMSNKRANIWLSRIASEAGIVGKKVTFHTSRHTFATQLLARGVPITTVQVLLGHTQLRTTQRYAQVKEQTVVNDLLRAAAAANLLYANRGVNGT